MAKYKYHKDMTLPQVHRDYVFVFGSNISGIHGAGAALVAKKVFGAEQFVGVGKTGNSYAIPTKDKRIKVLPLNTIIKYIEQFKEFTHSQPNLKFWITRVGCGLAGYHDTQITSLFKGCNINCVFAQEWKPYLED